MQSKQNLNTGTRQNGGIAMDKSTKGQNGTTTDTRDLFVTIQKSTLLDITNQVREVIYDAEVVQELLKSKAYTCDREEDLTPHLLFSARTIERFQYALADVELDMEHLL